VAATSHPSTGEYFWFLDTLVCIRLSHRDSTDGVSVIDHTAPEGHSPPLHIHVKEDEVFYLLDGEFRFRMAGQDRRASAGETVVAPKGTPHTFRVDSRTGRWLTVTVHQQFEDFVRTMSRPATTRTLPAAVHPTAEQIEALKETAKRFGTEIIGPPLAESVPRT
jgi:quercetin dioxygenase-like cupin family protein